MASGGTQPLLPPASLSWSRLVDSAFWPGLFGSLLAFLLFLSGQEAWLALYSKMRRSRRRDKEEDESELQCQWGVTRSRRCRQSGRGDDDDDH